MKPIDKDKVVKEIKRRIKEISQMDKWSYKIGLYDAYKIILSFLDTLEVKEDDSTAWKPADGDTLPEIDREVIAILNNGKVVYAHRPNPDGWNGKNIITGEVNHYDVQTYGKGEWNQPHVQWWLDLELPI